MSGIPRREFLAGVAAAPAVLAQRNPNDIIGVACIGVGTRGHQLMQEVQAVPNTEVRVVCDLYEGNINRAKGICKNPNARYEKDWESVVTARDVDGVIIATPDFWHAPQTIRAAGAGKDIYVEKGWCRTLPEAKAMRKAVKDNRVVMQLGHNYNSLPTFHRARQIYQSGELGKTPLIRSYIDRTGPYPEWQFYTNYNINELPKDANRDTIDWARFIANAPAHPFDADRFFTWRRWWDYGTGIAGDLMTHLWDGINMVAGMGIPESALTQGGLYFWKDGRNVPDMWHVLFDYPKKDLAVTFACTFNNRHQGEVIQFLGREKTLEVSPAFCRTYDGEWKPEYLQKLTVARRAAAQSGLGPENAIVPPDYVYKKGEVQVTGHMEDWIDCVRTRKTPRCGVDRAFEEAATLVLSLEAYRQERKVKWDPVREVVV